ncbi:hypothetical protein M758_5G106200 [Ceratodon purpureus]|nr:hypothetical protein M758_5G106200 [Ceratodon purpureus]
MSPLSSASSCLPSTAHDSARSPLCIADPALARSTHSFSPAVYRHQLPRGAWKRKGAASSCSVVDFENLLHRQRRSFSSRHSVVLSSLDNIPHELRSLISREHGRSSEPMAQPDPSIIVVGNSEAEQDGGSAGARRVANTSTPPRISTKTKLLELVFGPGKSKGEDVASTSESPSSNSMYPFARIERMMQRRSEIITDLEFEIESSKEHWSQISPMTDDSALGPHDADSLFDRGVLAGVDVGQGNRTSLAQYICNPEDYGRLDELLLCMLHVRFPHRFVDVSSEEVRKWKMGKKIGEGAQAEIYEARPTSSPYTSTPHIYKVFKKGFYLRDLQKLWPKPMARGYSTLYTCPIRKGTLLEDGRFALLMPRYWGDLRKLLDLRLQRRLSSAGPPLTYNEEVVSMECIARGMRDLHLANIVHRDLKASNVLVEFIRMNPAMGIQVEGKDLEDRFYCRVADFESSAGVVGTTFWRAPEILLAVKNHTITPDLFTEKSDVYSYGMTCYEILTGCIPFEEVSSSNYDVVLGGARPELPSHLDLPGYLWMREMLERCWHADPLQRPTFKEICVLIERKRIGLNIVEPFSFKSFINTLEEFWSLGEASWWNHRAVSFGGESTAPV